MLLAKIAAVTIFVLMFVCLITDRIPRHRVTLLCGALTLAVVFGLCLRDPGAIWQTLNLDAFFHSSFWYQSGADAPSIGINWETVTFIAGMMIMVEGMADSGFFRWLCISIARAVDFRPAAIFLIFMLLAAVLSLFIDSITVMMFLAAVTAELARLMKLNPVPLILAEIFCANLGGAATMCGDPPNIIIGTSLGYSFFDFIRNTGFISLIALVLVVPYFFLMFRSQIQTGSEAVDLSLFPRPKEAIRSRRSFSVSCGIFALAVLLLISHAVTGLTVSAIGVIVAALTLLSAPKNSRQLLRRVDWNTLLFFIGLFVAVSGLEYTGMLDLLAEGIRRISAGNVYVMLIIILWGSGLASALIDNIPFAATMIPVLRTLAQTQGLELPVLAWALSMGTDIGGSATPIGASANVVGTAIAARNGYPVTWKQYCKVQLPAVVGVLLLTTAVLFIRYL